MLNSHNTAFPHPLLNSRASPYPSRWTLRGYKRQPGLSCAHHGDAASLSLLTHLQGPSLHFISSGVGFSISLSFIMSWITAPWIPASGKSNWPWCTQGFPFRSDCSQGLLIDFLNKGAQSLQEQGKKQPNQQISMFTILIHSMGTYSQFLSQEKQPALSSKKSREARK